MCLFPPTHPKPEPCLPPVGSCIGVRAHISKVLHAEGSLHPGQELLVLGVSKRLGPELAQFSLGGEVQAAGHINIGVDGASPTVKLTGDAQVRTALVQNRLAALVGEADMQKADEGLEWALTAGVQEPHCPLLPKGV